MRLPGFPIFAFLLLALIPLTRAAPAAFQLTSPDFSRDGSIPARFTCDGKNVSPTLVIAGTPGAAKSLLLIVEDPDSVPPPFTHWLLWNIPPDTKKIPAGAPPATAVQGTNDFGTLGYSGPCPPSGTHRYLFCLCALDITLDLPAGASRKVVGATLRNHLLATALLMGRYA
jgi:Raf kinase inhibitor-like YbhB/YbcL family protein